MYSQKHGILFLLFVVWVISVPFRRYSVVATYSVDNLLAPILCLLAILLPRLRDQRVALKRVAVLLWVVALYGVYSATKLFKFFGNHDLLMSQGWLLVRDGFYFFVPMLYIRDLWSFRVMKRLIIFLAMVGALSAFLVAIGVLTLEVERFAESRLGEEWLPKSVGLFSNYGDLSILYGFVAVLLISHGREQLSLMGGRFAKGLIWVGLLLGLIGSQSRNMLFGTLIAMMVYWIWRRLEGARGSQRFTVVVLFFSGGLVLLGIIAVFGGQFVDTVSTLGGAAAAHTAQGRLESYMQALKLIAVEPFGLSYQSYLKWAGLADYIHNMWLRLLLNCGMIGMAVVAALYWLAFKGGNRAPQPPVQAAEPALVVASTAAVFVAVEFYGGLSDIMWVMLGTLISFNWVGLQRGAVDAPK